MSDFDNTNRGVGFVNNAHVGNVDFNGDKYKLVLVEAHKDAKIAYEMIVYNRENCLQSALFANDKQGNENRPDFKGQINGYWVSAWVKTSTKGNKFMSISVKAKDAPANTEFSQTRGGMDIEDTVPF